MNSQLDLTFAALADPTRRSILAHLSQGVATVNELVRRFELTQPTISVHLKVLEKAGLISRSRVAQTRPCKLEPAGLQAVDTWLQAYRPIWEANSARLDTLLQELQASENKHTAPKEKPYEHDPHP